MGVLPPLLRHRAWFSCAAAMAMTTQGVIDGSAASPEAEKPPLAHCLAWRKSRACVMDVGRAAKEVAGARAMTARTSMSAGHDLRITTCPPVPRR